MYSKLLGVLLWIGLAGNRGFGGADFETAV